MIGQIETPVEGQHKIKLKGIGRSGIARKFTIASELSQNFGGQTIGYGGGSRE